MCQWYVGVEHITLTSIGHNTCFQSEILMLHSFISIFK